MGGRRGDGTIAAETRDGARQCRSPMT
jgi:hypothetical protein